MPGQVLPVHTCPFIVAVDSREQLPWTFQGIVISGRRWQILTQVATLATGDYSIIGREREVAIERKSASDLLGSITHGNARFRREHERLRDIAKFGGKAGGMVCVIIEGSLSAICDALDDPFSGRQIGSEVVLGITASWPIRYGVQWDFAGDRRRAELLAFKRLLKWWWWEARELK